MTVKSLVKTGVKIQVERDVTSSHKPGRSRSAGTKPQLNT